MARAPRTAATSANQPAPAAATAEAPVAEMPATAPAKKAAKDEPVYGYVKGDKDPTTYDVTDPLYGNVDGARHSEWLAVNG